MFLAVADLRDTGGHDGWPWEWSEDPMATQALRLYRDGRLASAQEPYLQAAVPARVARYRLDLGSRLRSGTWVSLRTWARDAGDSRIHQTLVRAFPVR
jgi:hypothetical protein